MTASGDGSFGNPFPSLNGRTDSVGGTVTDVAARNKMRSVTSVGRRLVLAVGLVLLAVSVASARAASSNPYIPQDTVKRMEMNYGLPLALPGWLPSGYRFKGWVAVPQHSLILGFVRDNRLVWFMLSGRAGCRVSTQARPFVIPRGSAYRRCVAGAGTVTVWSLDEAPGGLRTVAARTKLSWHGRD